MSDQLKKSRRNSLMIAFGALAILFIGILIFSSTGKENGQVMRGYTAAPVAFDNISYELVGSESVGDKHTFEFKVTNTSNDPTNPKGVFAIINGEKRFGSNDVTYSTDRLNPGMEGTVLVTFDMNRADLTTGTPKFVIDRGLVFKDIQEIELKN
ncbi:hypothetical protein [Psychrobacillus sp. FSL K6-1267]|uniref:hypothetical protein n=1 Tax=Psychrobacillus sp. FSL K6-1267 TaxID=2921543 RepID=UPI0030F8E641